MAASPPGPSGPRIAIVGRPNVGKSTLFNRLIGKRKMVVATGRGTTRDRVDGRMTWRGSPLTLIDMGGVEFDISTALGQSVQRHVERAVQEADGVLLVCDARDGLVPADAMIMERLRKAGKPVVLTINKSDQRLDAPADFFSLGLSPIFPVSALHGRGIGELLDHLTERFGALGSAAPASGTDTYAVAIVGRQNVGKSSLLNALLREERVIVGEQPGTTRDAVDTVLTVEGVPVTLIDTAGLRHRRKVRDPVDTFSMSRSLEAIARCDVALVVLDGTQGVTTDDRRILTQVIRAGCGLLLVVNKWDLVKGGNERTLTEAMKRQAPFAAFAPALAVSAKTNFQVAQSLARALVIAGAVRRGVGESTLLPLLKAAWAAQPPPRYHGRAIRLREARCAPGRPIRIALTTSPSVPLARPYRQYLLKRLHAHPRLAGIPVRLVTMMPESRR